MRRAMDKFVVSPERKLHYSNLHSWLKLHPKIEFKKLSIGFSINVGTIPDELSEEFLKVCTFVGD